MSAGQQNRVLLAVLSECTSAAGNPYLRGWAGASNLVAFHGDPDEQGRPTWNLYLAERQPKADAQPRQEGGPALPRAEAPAQQIPRTREHGGGRQERAAREVLGRYPDNGLHDAIPF